MATVYDVAKYILEKVGEIDTWKLQKLVYYCQAWSLVWDDKPLFVGRIEAWANGPVCVELYQIHKGLYKVNSKMKIWGSASSDNLTEDERDTVNVVIEDYGDKPGHWLRALTHLEEPWKIARGDTPALELCTNEITIESMKEYYASI